VGAAGLVIDRALVLFFPKEKCFVFVGMPFCGEAPQKQKHFFLAGIPRTLQVRESRGDSDFRRRVD